MTTHNHRRWKSIWSPELDEVAEYRRQDYFDAMQEIRSLADRVSNGDVSLVRGEGFFIPKNLDVVELWVNDDGYHSRFGGNNKK